MEKEDAAIPGWENNMPKGQSFFSTRENIDLYFFNSKNPKYQHIFHDSLGDKMLSNASSYLGSI